MLTYLGGVPQGKKKLEKNPFKNASVAEGTTVTLHYACSEIPTQKELKRVLSQKGVTSVDLDGSTLMVTVSKLNAALADIEKAGHSAAVINTWMHG
jgi:hypothetical protein